MVLSAELKYELAVRSHSATTVTTRLTKRPYIPASTFLPLLSVASLPPFLLFFSSFFFCRGPGIVVASFGIVNVTRLAFYEPAESRHRASVPLAATTGKTKRNEAKRNEKKKKRKRGGNYGDSFVLTGRVCLSRQSSRCNNHHRCFCLLCTRRRISIHMFPDSLSCFFSLSLFLSLSLQLDTS